jgi:hypothetical protein
MRGIEMKRLLLVALLALTVSCGKANVGSESANDLPVKQVDAVMVIDTTSKRIRLVDDASVEVGSLEFDEQVTVTIKRHKK